MIADFREITAAVMCMGQTIILGDHTFYSSLLQHINFVHQINLAYLLLLDLNSFVQKSPCSQAQGPLHLSMI